MIDFSTGNTLTTHTTDTVPFFWVSKHSIGKTLEDGKLSDIAPTMLKEMGVEKPEEMTGHSLIK